MYANEYTSRDQINELRANLLLKLMLTVNK